MERMSAVTHLLSSLEYLARGRDRRRGGLNDWEVSRRAFHARWPRLSRPLDLLADRRATAAIHLARLPAALILMGPGHRRLRLAANAGLAGTSLALYPRHHYGTDGSDQVSFLVQSMATLARASERRPRLVDACLWFAAMQSALSYAVSGWVKLASPTWRSGEALPLVMRTRTYGDRRTWDRLRRHPRAARVLGTTVLAMECLFPVAFLARGRLAPAMVSSAAAFHVGNARVMGLGRFVWSFLSMHPAVLYASSPRVAPRAGGPPRDDTLPALTGGLMALGLGAATAAQARRRSTVRRPRPGGGEVRTSSGATLAYRSQGHDDGRSPVVVLESGLLATEEHWGWIARGLAPHLPTITYQRAGYGSSSSPRRGDYRLEVAVDDLVDVVDHVAPGRPVVLVGHSLGGYLALRAAPRLSGRLLGIGLLDSAHPAEMERSSRQGKGQEALSASLRLMPASLHLGLGALLERPDWVDQLPADLQPGALAQYRDPRLWSAGRREWLATLEDFGAREGRLPDIEVPLLVMTTERTATRDPVQHQLHQEMAAAAPEAGHHVISGADHDGVLSDRRFAGQVVDLTAGFVDRLAGSRPEEANAC